MADTTTRINVSIPFKRETISKGWIYAAQMMGRATWVSIPFKRESISKVLVGLMWMQTINSFNSLQTGNHIQSSMSRLTIKTKLHRFQFPSNGKPYPKTWMNHYLGHEVMFQFPSNGKAYPKSIFAYQRLSYYQFQFPSNGKPYPKL